MSSYKLTVGTSLLLALFVVSLSSTTAQADPKKVKWERIEGAIVPGTGTGATGPPNFNVVAGINSSFFSWTVGKGHAMANLRTSQVTFDVNGLVLAGHPEFAAAIGTVSSTITMVKGTVICDSLDATPDVFDTPAVPLSPQGDADFQGITTASLPMNCPDAVFLIRGVAAPILDLWIAHGAVRTP